jgi:nucleotide-binding universal stress UspA family protein
MLTRVLVATDFSHSADDAFDFAIDLALRLPTDVLLLHVAMVTRLVTEAGVRPDVHAAASELARRVERAAVTGVRVTPLLCEGEPAEMIATVSRREDVDLVIVGSHHQESETLLIGSLAERLIRRAPCNVLVVKRRAAGAAGQAA